MSAEPRPGPTAEPTVDRLRAEARAWMDANLRRRDPDAPRKARGSDHKTVEGIAEQRVLQRRMYEAGLTGISWPSAYGGRGLSAEHEAAVAEERTAYLTPDFGICGPVTMIVCANVMLAHASEDFKRRHLPRILSGDELWVEFFSEPSAGSDMAGITTTAVRDGDRWVLNGSKIWTSGAYYADWGMCLARTDWDVPKHRGLTWFAVPTNAPGVTVEPLKEITGDVEFCQETFVDVVIPDSERIGDVNDGWSVAQTALFFEREASSGGLVTGVRREGAPPLAPDLVALARRAGRETDPHVRQLIAKAHTRDYALTQLGVRIAALMQGAPNGMALIGYTKLAAGTFEPERARIGLEISGAGAMAWQSDDLVATTSALNFLNSRVTAIAGGSNEMQRNGIGERVLGLPREPSSDRDRSFREVLDNAKNWSAKG